MHRLILAFLAMSLLTVPSVQAGFADPLPYSDESDFTQQFSGLPALVSGHTDFDANGVQNATLLLGTTGFKVSGIERVCFETDDNQLGIDCKQGDISVELLDGGSAAFRSPNLYGISMDAEHSLVFFGDASKMFGESNQENVEFGPSVVAIPTDEQIVVRDIDRIPISNASSFRDFNSAVATGDMALIITMTGDSTLVISDDAGEIKRLAGAANWVGFQGSPVFTATQANMAVLPMPNGSSATFTPSTPEAAAEGLSAENLGSAFGDLGDSEGEGDANALGPLSDVAGLMSGLLNGAILDMSALDGGGNPADLLQAVTLVRFEQLDASRDSEQVSFQGEAPLQITNGEVAGAQPLFFFAPITAYILWGLAIVLLVLRIAIKPSKNHPVWDKFHWVGRLAGLGAAALVFVLWDRAMLSLWGSSLLAGGATGAQGQLIIAALQLIPLLLAGLFFGLPTRIIAKSATRFLGQGRMMNIGWVAAPFVTLWLGVPLLLSLIAALLQSAGQFIGG